MAKPGDFHLRACVRHKQSADQGRDENECLHAMDPVSKGASCTFGDVRQLDQFIAL